MLTDYMAAGGQEIWNSLRLQTYLTNVGSPFTTGPGICVCSTLTAEMLGQTGGYTTPVADPAPWYDADQPVTGEFLGFLPLSVSGIDDNPMSRNVTGGVGGGGIFGPARALPRTMVVSGLLIGASCCGADFGLQYLSLALAGCNGAVCDGDCVNMFNCCPSESMTQPEFVAEHRRTFRRVALTSGPTVTRRVATAGGSCAGTGSCSGNGDIIEVEFVLVAAVPWSWTDPVELLNVNLPGDSGLECIDWCLSSGGGADECLEGECAHAPCQAAVDACADPMNTVPAPPQPVIPEASFCVPLATERVCYTLDLSDRPNWSTDVPIITISAGSEELRNVRITMYEKPQGSPLTCDEIADQYRCTPANDFIITYAAPNSEITIDGQIGQVQIYCDGDCRTASTVFGSVDGGPPRINELTCAEYCLCIETDPNFAPAANAELTFSISGKVY